MTLPSLDLLAAIIAGEAAPCTQARYAVARCLAECLQRGDDAETTARRWMGRATPTEETRALAAGVLDGSIRPNGMYYCMSQQDVDAHGWVDGDLVVRCGGYANHLYREWPKVRQGMKLSEYPIPRNGSKRGMHWSASCYPEEPRWPEHLALCRDMGIGFIKFVDDGGASGMNVYRSCWHDYGIIPVIRFYIGTPGQCGPREADAIKRIADVLGFRTYFELCNEPDLPIEWGNNRPHDWLQRSINAYCDYAPKVWAAGGLPGTFALASGALSQQRVDERGNVLDPVRVNFIKIIVDQLGGAAAAQSIGLWLSDHNYTINHPPDYPYDAVNQAGQPLTAAEYNAVPLWAWDNRPMEAINAQRARDKNPGDTIWDDDTCFNGYQIFLAYAREAGIDVPLITTEGGPTLTRGDDGRYPKVTQDIMLDWLPRMYRVIGQERNYFGHCHWLLYNTTYGWESDRWLYGAEDYSRCIALFKSNAVGTWGEKFSAAPIPEPVPTPTPTPTYPPLPVDNDAAAYGVRIVPCAPEPGAWYWQIVRVHHLRQEENNGNHNLFVDVLDETGRRVNGARVQLNYPNGRVGIVIIDKPANEPGGNAPLWKDDVVQAGVIGEPPLTDYVLGISTQHPDEPPGNTLFHHSFLIVWRKVQAVAVEPEPTPEPTPEPLPTEEELRNAAWNAYGLPYNPDAAFPHYARAHSLGLPVTPETDFRGVRWQGYAGGIVYAPIGEWDKTTHISW